MADASVAPNPIGKTLSSGELVTTPGFDKQLGDNGRCGDAFGIAFDR